MFSAGQVLECGTLTSWHRGDARSVQPLVTGEWKLRGSRWCLSTLLGPEDSVTLLLHFGVVGGGGLLADQV